MKRKSILLIATMVVFATALSLAISSCDGNSTDPVNPGATGGGIKGGGGKGAEILTNGASLVGISRTGLGGATLSFNQLNAELTVDNLLGESGLSSRPDIPGNVWSQDIEGEWPGGANGGLRFRSLNNGIETSTLEIWQRVVPVPGEFDAVPSFTGNPESNVFSLVLYDANNVEIGREDNIPILTPIRIVPVISCCQWLNRNRFIVDRATGRCIWSLLWNRCCRWRVYYGPRIWDVSRVDFVEGEPEGGGYPYHDFTEIQVQTIRGGIGGSLRVTSEFVAAVP